MRRRALLALAFLPFVARGQPARRPYYRIGFVAAAEDRLTREFVEAMKDLGYEEGRHYALVLRAAPEELLALQPDVLVANASSTAAALKAKTATIPIVLAGATDPVAEGLAESLSRPGANLTGMTSYSQALHARLVEFANVLLPGAKRMGFVVNPDHLLAQGYEAVARRAARRVGVEIVAYPVRAGWDLERLGEQLARAQVDALLVSADAALYSLRERLVKAALDVGVPTISALPDFAEPGALATYGHDPAANWRRAASYVDRILKGAKPAELPIEQPTQFELVVNMRTAAGLGIVLPQATLLLSSRRIE
jgi:putative ABC transport system substrate-binding protein